LIVSWSSKKCPKQEDNGGRRGEGGWKRRRVKGTSTDAEKTSKKSFFINTITAMSHTLILLQKKLRYK
jgi:hypothetical protein